MLSDAIYISSVTLSGNPRGKFVWKLLIATIYRLGCDSLSDVRLVSGSIGWELWSLRSLVPAGVSHRWLTRSALRVGEKTTPDTMSTFFLDSGVGGNRPPTDPRDRFVSFAAEV